MNNLNIIANYLFDNPGARYTDITRHLCAEKDKTWTRGQYCQYFIKPYYRCDRSSIYRDKLWTKCGKGWILTVHGMGYVTKYL